MASRTNRSATRRTVGVLRKAGRLNDADAAVIRLAESTDIKPYAVAAAARAHREALAALLEYAEPTDQGDMFEQLLAELATPSLSPRDSPDPARPGSAERLQPGDRGWSPIGDPAGNAARPRRSGASHGQVPLDGQPRSSTGRVLIR